MAGDTVYGAAKPKLGLTGQALHAVRLTLRHPGTGENMTFCRAAASLFQAGHLLQAGRVEAEDIEAVLDKSLTYEEFLMQCVFVKILCIFFCLQMLYGGVVALKNGQERFISVRNAEKDW